MRLRFGLTYLFALTLELGAQLAWGQNCSQYNQGGDPYKSYTLQECCSSFGAGGSFATSDSFCQANPYYFVYFNTTGCNNNCAPPSTAAFDTSSKTVIPVLGWKRGSGNINVCVSASFSSPQYNSITTGVSNAFSAVGLTPTFINNTTDSRCSQTNAYQVLYSNTSPPAYEGLTTYSSVAWNSGDTAEYVQQASTTMYMGYNPNATQLQAIATHEALHSDGLDDDYYPGCDTSQTYMWFQVAASASDPAVGSLDKCSDTATGKRTSAKQSGSAPPPPPQPPTAPPENNCTGSYYCPDGSSLICGPEGWYCSGGTQGCAGGEPECSDNTTPECSNGSWTCESDCSADPEPEPCCDDCYEACEDNEWVCVGSPIVLDVEGKGFHFTDIPHGVRFRVLPKKELYQMSWPAAEFGNGWLALDRNGDGKITDFTELFGNATPQPPSEHPNGYLALAVFDDPKNGGNGNGYIDPGDAIYKHLRIWIDDNHNGISEPGELHTLPEAGVFRIDLNYFLSPYVDENGNIFRYKSRIWDQAGKEHQVCYDVFVKIANGR